ncbi:MAG: hypothetical protein IPL04_12945 [Chitinophagaceae bacterium]|nr:hypothetical protein [Chitinophagaceae bacterium]
MAEISVFYKGYYSATTSNNTPSENKDVSKLNEGEKPLPTLAKEFVGLETIEDSGEKIIQVKGQITTLLAGFTYKQAKRIALDLIEELQGVSVIGVPA